jgi:hypothetical protein
VVTREEGAEWLPGVFCAADFVGSDCAVGRDLRSKQDSREDVGEDHLVRIPLVVPKCIDVQDLKSSVHFRPYIPSHPSPVLRSESHCQHSIPPATRPNRLSHINIILSVLLRCNIQRRCARTG